jgi:uncharacterized protein YcfL
MSEQNKKQFIMKQLFVILATATILASCNSASNTEAPTTDSTTVVVDTTSQTVDTCAAKCDTTQVVK